jgi:hypothetical protein
VLINESDQVVPKKMELEPADEMVVAENLQVKVLSCVRAVV